MAWARERRRCDISEWEGHQEVTKGRDIRLR